MKKDNYRTKAKNVSEGLVKLLDILFVPSSLIRFTRKQLKGCLVEKGKEISFYEKLDRWQTRNGCYACAIIGGIGRLFIYPYCMNNIYNQN